MSIYEHIPAFAGFAAGTYRGYCMSQGINASLIDPAIVVGATLWQAERYGSECLKDGSYGGLLATPFAAGVGALEGSICAGAGYLVGYIAGKVL